MSTDEKKSMSRSEVEMIGVVVPKETKRAFQEVARLESMSMSELGSLLVEAYIQTRKIPGA